MSKAGAVDLSGACGGIPAHLYFDLFSFHHYFQIILANTPQYQDTRQCLGNLGKMNFLLEVVPDVSTKSDLTTQSHGARQFSCMTLRTMTNLINNCH
jgi:hypothetical protein